jgi:NAD(P)-dependent dehydrogenase (short-subunit alcohol dehydrogenase family)
MMLSTSSLKKQIPSSKFQSIILSLLFSLFPLSMIAEGVEPQSGKGLTVLITGANRGLGLEFAKQFSAKGYKVIGTARKPEDATALKATGAQIVKLDVTSDESIAAVAQLLAGKKIDILLNNAGYLSRKSTREEMTRCFTINTLGPYYVTEALLPNLKLSDHPKIINISSRSGKLSEGKGSLRGYSISKTALNMVTRHFHSKLKGMIVISLAPGHNKTDMGGLTSGKFEPKDTIGSMIPFIEKLTEQKSGKFWYFDGTHLDW